MAGNTNTTKDIQKAIIAQSRRLGRLADMVTVAGGGRESIPVLAPFTGETIAAVPAATSADVQEALNRARKAQAQWAKRPISERKALFLRYHDLVLSRQDELLDLIQIESGKARPNALEEVLDLAINARHYACRAARYMRPKRRKGAVPLLVNTREYHHPVGIVGIVAPWNYPLTLTMSDAVPALLAGNAVIVKPSRQTPFIALFAVQLLQEAGLPKDLCQVLTGHAQEVVPPLVSGIAFLGFTGSTETGRHMASQAGQNLIKCSMELGGKNPMIVFNDAPLKRTVQGAVHGCFSNAGQLCISIERLYVQRKIFNHFVDLFVEKTRSLRVGACLNYEADVGSLISQEQLDRVTRHVQGAIDKGAKILAGGRARPDLGPYFFEPTLLTGITPEMTLACEETFGPVVSIYPFETVQEALKAANDSEYGLNASIWTRNTSFGRKLAQKIQCGTVNINEAYTATYGSVDAPMGGMKKSGIGRRHGKEGFLKYTEPQTVAVQRLLSIAPEPGIHMKHRAQLVTHALRVLRHAVGFR